jgi:hypothetical protein
VCLNQQLSSRLLKPTLQHSKKKSLPNVSAPTPRKQARLVPNEHAPRQPKLCRRPRKRCTQNAVFCICAVELVTASLSLPPSLSLVLLTHAPATCLLTCPRVLILCLARRSLRRRSDHQKTKWMRFSLMSTATRHTSAACAAGNSPIHQPTHSTNVRMSMMYVTACIQMLAAHPVCQPVQRAMSPCYKAVCAQPHELCTLLFK